MQDDILKLAYEVSSISEKNIHLIDSVMGQARFLAINAHIEAARAGEAGAAFAIIANEMGKIASTIVEISAGLRSAIQGSTDRLKTVGADLVRSHRGERYADLALNIIELIDRNLYERSCDVRWWATDNAVVEAVQHGTPAALAHAMMRLNTILKSYTVYIDLMITNAQGQIIACGRPDRHPRLVGTDACATDWFSHAMRTSSGDHYAVADVCAVRALNDAESAIYATAIRAGGEVHGKSLGVLAIAFDWAPQAAAIVQGVRLSPEEWRSAKVMIVDANHQIIAAAGNAAKHGEVYQFTPQGPRGYYQAEDKIIAYALTPGYETYRGLGWYGVIEAQL
jgi:hypothetical protein